MGGRRRPLPGEGSDRLGTNFGLGLTGGVDENININIGAGGGAGELSPWIEELVAVAVEYRRNLEEGHLPIRNAVAHYLGLSSVRGFWPFSSIDENGLVYDLTAQGRHLTASSITYLSVGLSQLIPAANFSIGASRDLSRSDEPGLAWDGLDGWTVFAWVLPQWTTQDSNYAPVISKGDLSGTLEYAVRVRRNSMRVRVHAGSDSFFAPTSLALNHSEWNFLAAGYHEAADLYRVFVNGNHADERPGNAPTLTATTDPFYVGRVVDGASSDHWDGAMALVCFVGDTLGEDVIRNVWEGTRRAFGI